LPGQNGPIKKFTEDVIRGFAEVQSQNPDGRIDLWGGSTVRGQVADVTSLPRYFEALMMLPGAVMIPCCRRSFRIDEKVS